MDKDLYQIIKATSYLREKSDYDDFYLATKEKAEEQALTAKELIKQIETYCVNRMKDCF